MRSIFVQKISVLRHPDTKLGGRNFRMGEHVRCYPQRILVSWYLCDKVGGMPPASLYRGALYSTQYDKNSWQSLEIWPQQRNVCCTLRVYSLLYLSNERFFYCCSVRRWFVNHYFYASNVILLPKYLLRNSQYHNSSKIQEIEVRRKFYFLLWEISVQKAHKHGRIFTNFLPNESRVSHMTRPGPSLDDASWQQQF